MAYTKITWQNEITPLNAENMNRIEEGIEDAHTAIDGMTATIRDMFYPVGSYYETSDSSFNPNTAWGGVWSLEAAGKVHIGAGTGYTIGDTGGNKDAIIPYHNHRIAARNTNGMSANASHRHGIFIKRSNAEAAGYGLVYSSGGFNDRVFITSTTNGQNTEYTSVEHTHTLPEHYTEVVGTSGNSTNANMQPYIVVNRWHRTA